MALKSDILAVQHLRTYHFLDSYLKQIGGSVLSVQL